MKHFRQSCYDDAHEFRGYDPDPFEMCDGCRREFIPYRDSWHKIGKYEMPFCDHCIRLDVPHHFRARFGK